MFNLPGRVASFGRASDGGTRGFFAAVVDDPAAVNVDDPSAAVRLAREAFRGHELPVVMKLIAGMERAEHLFFDTVSQIRMNRWYDGRVALVGDSAYAPSFLSGQGTGIAVIGAYVLATELASHADPVQAFAAYDATIRSFIERNQAIALRTKPSNVLPRDAQALRERNLRYRAMPWLRRLHLTRFVTRGVGDIATSLDLAGYGIA
jgi:2-polyprenyl-6-methoxyphenol hydroxylase-like FAD-dependent oxidoreductase